MFDAYQPTLPLFWPVSVIGRKARPVVLHGHGNTLRSFNIITKDEINERIYALCEHVINPIISGHDATFVPVLNGAINFYSAISHHVNEGSHVELMSVQARSYGTEETPGPVFVNPDSIIPRKITGRTVIILDDILDTGQTVKEVIRQLAPHKPARIVTVFLLRKEHAMDFQPNYWLFDVHPDSWVFGFGLDYKEKYRQLRFICDKRTEFYQPDGTPLY